MRIFQMNGRPDLLEFTNYERVDEEILFEQILEKLQCNPNVVIGERQIGPSEDFYNCSIGKFPFTLVYDLVYGPSVHSENPEAIKKLIEYFE